MVTPQPVLDTKTEALRVQVHRLLSYILRRPIGGIENPCRAAEPCWDSLKHIELMFLLEDHFQVRFTPEEMAGLEDAAGIECLLGRLIEERHAT
jgi:acyl carrier protein